MPPKFTSRGRASARRRPTFRKDRLWNATAAAAFSVALLTPVLGTAAGRDLHAPTAPGPIAAVSSSASSIALSWGPSSDDDRVAGYELSWNGAVIARPRQTDYVVKGLSCGMTYAAAVVGFDQAGNKSAATSAVVATAGCDTKPPTAPGTPTQVGKTATSLTLAWTHASDNTAVTGYGVYVNSVAAGATAELSHTVSGLACGRSYTVGVDAVDAAANRSSQSASVMATAACTSSGGSGGSTGDTQPPSTPTGLAAANVGATSVTLSWKGATDNVGVAGYTVFLDGQNAGTTTATTREVGGLACGTEISLGVEAFDAAGNRSSRTAIAVTTGACSSSPTPSKPATLFVSPSGSDGGLCTVVAPCASWGRAYGLAVPGSVVEVAGGRYPGQLLPFRAALRDLSPGCAPASPGQCVLFRPAAGASVTVDGGLEVRGSSVWVKGSVSGSGVPSRQRSFNLRVNGYVDTEAKSAVDHPDHVIFEGIDAVNFGAFNVDTVTFKNMDVGPATVSSGCAIKQGPGFENKIGWGGGITYVPRNVTLDGLLIHNQNGDSGRIASDCHFGGLFIVTVDGLTIRNSVFSQNVVYNIQVQNFGGAPAPRNVTIENNWFGCSVEWLYVSETTCANQADIQFNAASRFSNWLIRYNSFVGGLGQYVPGASYDNVRVLGNAGSRPSNCYPGWTFAYNAWVNGSCSATDRSLAALPFANATPGQEDLLLAGASAVDLVTSTTADSVVATDIRGKPRPLGAGRDAGATEVS